MPNNKNFQTNASQKPYDFVPLPDPELVINAAIAGHHTAIGSKNTPLLSGEIRGTIVSGALTHIASGIVSLINELRAFSGPGQNLDLNSIGKDELVMPHVQTSNVRIIPGSTIKGMLRAAVEAITNPGTAISPPSLPSKRRQTQNNVLKQTLQKSPVLSEISLANRLFGLTDEGRGYQGQCTFYDAPQVKGSAQIFHRLPLYSPQPYFSQTNHAQTNYQLYFTDAARREFRGRKFYRSGVARTADPPYTAVEACNKDSEFNFEMRFSNLNHIEIGILLIIFGLTSTNSSKKIPQLNVGGGKPLAMGTIRFTGIDAKIIADSTYTDFDTRYDELGLISCVDAAYASGVIFEAGLDKLIDIMSKKMKHTAGGSEKERIY